MYGCLDARDWVNQSFNYGDDESVMLIIEYTGSTASGIVDIDSAGDITFKHGVLSSEAVDTDIKIDSGGSGILDLSADVDDYNSLERHINTFDNWKCWLKGALPDDDPHTTTTGHFTEVTGGNANNAAGGYSVKTDDSDSNYIGAGLTNRNLTTRLHDTDHQVIHQLQRLRVTGTWAGTDETIKVYECDDDSGVSVEVLAFTPGADTVEVSYPAATAVLSEIPLWEARGKRIVVKVAAPTGLSLMSLQIEGRSAVVGPHARRTKMGDFLATG